MAEIAMFYWSAVFLVAVLVTGLLGFAGIAGASTGMAQLLFGVFLLLLVASLICGIARRARQDADGGHRPG